MTAGMGSGAALRRLKKRSEFLAAARGRRAGRSAFSVQMTGAAPESPGVGFTVTNRVGNAPERNRIRRRLRAVAGTCAAAFDPRHDYVLIGRREALSEPFARLVRDLESALAKLHATGQETPRSLD